MPLHKESVVLNSSLGFLTVRFVQVDFCFSCKDSLLQLLYICDPLCLLLSVCTKNKYRIKLEIILYPYFMEMMEINASLLLKATGHCTDNPPDSLLNCLGCIFSSWATQLSFNYWWIEEIVELTPHPISFTHEVNLFNQKRNNELLWFCKKWHKCVHWAVMCYIDKLRGLWVHPKVPRTWNSLWIYSWNNTVYVCMKKENECYMNGTRWLKGETPCACCQLAY